MISLYTGPILKANYAKDSFLSIVLVCASFYRYDLCVTICVKKRKVKKKRKKKYERPISTKPGNYYSLSRVERSLGPMTQSLELYKCP